MDYIICRNPKAPQELARQVLTKMSLPETPYIVMDQNDWEEYEGLQNKLGMTLPHFHPPHLFDLPPHLQEIRNRAGFRFLVWLSARLCNREPPTEFCLTLAHELQHVRQAIDDATTYKLSCLLHDDWPERGDEPWIHIPLERDAERAGKQMVFHLLGSSAFDELIEERLTGCLREDRVRWEVLRGLDPDVGGDLRSETTHLICVRREEFKRKQRTAVGLPYITEFDFDELCRG